jgi:hypothetical protein
MIRILAILLGVLLVTPADAATSVWGFRGWGLPGWSRGVDQIARQARHIPNVTSVRVYNYYDTQRVADEIRRAPGKVVIFGYSCGANASVVTANAFQYQRNIDAVLGMQPSIWCGGGYETAVLDNVGYAQNTFASCIQTLGLGCQRWYGARHLRQIYRAARHGQADTDPAYQQDVLRAINLVANGGTCDPARHHCHGHTLIVHRAPGGGTTHTLIHHD